MSMWVEYGLDKKVQKILKVPMQARVKKSSCGNPFMTSYQIAIAFKQGYPEDFEKIGKSIGGSGTDTQNSLTRYIAETLTKRIRDKKIKKVECGSLSVTHREGIPFKDGEETIYSSAKYDLVLFRAKS
jgi:hypothetical protein